MSIDYIILTKKTEIILNHLHKLNDTSVNIKKKINLINTINTKLENNTILKQDFNNNLSFQSIILKNEFYYYTNIYDCIIDKYSKELYELSEYIIIILISLNKLEIGTKEEKQKLFCKLIYTKQTINIGTGKLNEIINSIINNLKVIDEYIKLFDKYIIELKRDNKDKNIHNNSFELTINYKKETICLEYSKYCNKFIKIIDYFDNCLHSIINQIDTSQLLKFFLKLKATI